MSKEMDFAQLVAQEDEINLLRKQVEQLEAELQQARQTAEFWKAEHLSGNKLIDELRAKIAALEAENKRLREALEARRDWFAAQLKSASKGSFSAWDRHALQIECDAADEALAATEQKQ